MIKIMRYRFRESKNVCEGEKYGEPFQQGDANNTLPNIFEKKIKISQQILRRSCSGGINIFIP